MDSNLGHCLLLVVFVLSDLANLVNCLNQVATMRSVGFDH